MIVKTVHDVVAPQKDPATGKMYVLADSAKTPIGFKFESGEEMVNFAKTLLDMTLRDHDTTIWLKKGLKIDHDAFTATFKDEQKPLLQKFEKPKPPKAISMKKPAKKKKGNKK